MFGTILDAYVNLLRNSEYIQENNIAVSGFINASSYDTVDTPLPAVIVTIGKDTSSDQYIGGVIRDCYHLFFSVYVQANNHSYSDDEGFQKETYNMPNKIRRIIEKSVNSPELAELADEFGGTIKFSGMYPVKDTATKMSDIQERQIVMVTHIDYEIYGIDSELYDDSENTVKIVDVNVSCNIKNEVDPIDPDPDGNDRERRDNHIKNIKVALLGDTITTNFGVPNETYDNFIKTKFETDTVFNFGIEGGVVTRVDSIPNVFQDWVTNMVNDSGAELLVVMVGTNDYYQSMNLGNPREQTIPDSFEFSNVLYNKMAEYLSHLVNIGEGLKRKILICTPPPSYYFGHTDREPNMTGNSMIDYVNAIKTVAKRLHIPVCDLFSDLSWSPDREGASPYYTTDGVHLSVEGYNRITDLIYNSAWTAFYTESDV